MEITWLGALLIPFFTVLLFRKPVILLYSAIFFSGFSASSVLNFPKERFGFQPSQLAISFLFLHFLFLRNRPARISQTWVALVNCLKPNTPFLGAFLILDILSLAMAPEGFTHTGVTQFIHIGFGSAAMALTAVYVSEWGTPNDFLKVIFWSGIAISLWGILQLIFFYLNIPYPDFLFNNSASKNALGFQSMLETARVLRVSSVATEPSILSKFLVPILAAMLGVAKMTGSVFRIPKWHIAAILVTLLISTSSGAFAGIVAIFIFNFIKIRTLMRNRRFLIGLFATLGLVIGFTLSFPTLIQEMVLYKFYSFSFLERMASVIDGVDIFASNPFLGVGWGNFQGFDFLVKTLASTGLLGTIAFVGFLVKSIRVPLACLRRSEISDTDKTAVIALSTMAGFQIFQMSVVGFFPSYQDFWIIFGMLSGASCVLRRTQSPTHGIIF